MGSYYGHHFIFREVGTATWQHVVDPNPTDTYVHANLSQFTTYEFRIASICDTIPLLKSEFSEPLFYTTGAWSPFREGTSELDFENEMNLEVASLSLFPNPTSGSLKVQWGNEGVSRLAVTDVSGAVLISKTVIGHSKSLQLEHLPNGIYFVAVENDAQSSVRKVVVAR